MSPAHRELGWAVAAVLTAEAMGAALLGAAYLLYEQSADFIERAWPVEGVVIAYDPSAESEGPILAGPVPLILFQTSRGEPHRFKAGAYAAWRNLRIGDKVTVLYDPHDPSDARLDDFFQFWAGATFAASLGGLFALVPAGALAWAVCAPAKRLQ